MYFTSAFIGLALSSGVLAAVATTACNANNCARAVTGTRTGKMPDVTSRMADCSSFQKVTVTPATSTVITTATVTVTNILPGKRQAGGSGPVTVSPSGIPVYASACSSPAAYSSACSCWGITATTITVPTPVTTVTVTATVTVNTCPAAETLCSGACHNLRTDPNNCGACGTTCASGATCVNGVCDKAYCAANEYALGCDPAGTTGLDCACFIGIEGNGFCIYNYGSCTPPCASSNDCPLGEVCITATSCGADPICAAATAECANVSLPMRLFRKRDGKGQTLTPTVGE